MNPSALPVGIPREIKAGEKRAGLTPAGAGALGKAGISVFIEKGAGEAAGFKDEEYARYDAKIVPGARDLYRQARLIQKVKEPLAPEFEFLTGRHLLFCFLHLASPENRPLTEVLLRQKVTALGFETVEKSGRTLLLEPMSEIAGSLGACFAAFFIQSVQTKGGRVVYPPGLREKLTGLAVQYPGVPRDLAPVKAVVFGGGTAGQKAAEVLLGLGGSVDLVEKREERREELAHRFKSFSDRLRLWRPDGAFQNALRDSDAWVGSVHVAGNRAPQVLTREEVGQFSAAKKKILIDIAADQGGNFPGTHSTTYDDPLFLDEFGNFRFGVTNIPSLCGRAASEALEKAAFPYTRCLAQEGTRALREFPELQKGMQIYRGCLVNPSVAEAHGLTWEPLKL